MVSKRWKIKLSPLPSSRPLKNQVITFTQFSTIELTTNVALQETLPAIALSQQSLLAHRADHIVLQGFWKGSVNNVAREELEAIHEDYCYSTGLPTTSSIRCESRKCINFTFYDQLESRVVRLILTDLINVYKHEYVTRKLSGYISTNIASFEWRLSSLHQRFSFTFATWRELYCDLRRKDGFFILFTQVCWTLLFEDSFPTSKSTLGSQNK